MIFECYLCCNSGYCSLHGCQHTMSSSHAVLYTLLLLPVSTVRLLRADNAPDTQTSTAAYDCCQLPAMPTRC